MSVTTAMRMAGWMAMLPWIARSGANERGFQRLDGVGQGVRKRGLTVAPSRATRASSCGGRPSSQPPAGAAGGDYRRGHDLHTTLLRPSPLPAPGGVLELVHPCRGRAHDCRY